MFNRKQTSTPPANSTSNRTSFFLIDYENINSDGIQNVTEIQQGDTLVIFYSEHCKSISIDILNLVTKMNLKVVTFQVTTGTKNALDFQLTSYLGYLIGNGNKEDSYFIISNDKGYDSTIEFWKAQSVSVTRIPTQKPVAKNPDKPKASKKTSKQKAPKTSEKPKSEKPKSEKPKAEKEKDNTVTAKPDADSSLVTLEEIKKYLAEDEIPEEILPIVNKYKTKQAIYNGISKHVKDSKRASTIYNKLKPLLKEKKKN